AASPRHRAGGSARGRPRQARGGGAGVAGEWARTAAPPRRDRGGARTERPVKTRAVIAGVGARTPLGLAAQPTALVYRTASVVMQHGPLCDGDGELANICALPTVDPRLTGMLRAAEL